MAMFNGTAALDYPRCEKHGRYEFDCEECALEERRKWAREDALAILGDVRQVLTGYATSDVMFYLERLEEELKEMEVEA